MPIIPWVVRNYKVTNGDIIIFEKFYHESPMGMGRSQTYLSKWWMCFGNPRPEEMVFKMLEGNKQDTKSRYTYIKHFSENLPAHVYDNISPHEIFKALKEMQDCYYQKQITYGESIKILSPNDKELICEFEVKNHFSLLIKKYKIEHPIRYYIVTPIFVRGKEFIFQSFSSMYGSLNPSTQEFSLIQKVIKGIFYLLNLSLFLAFFINFFLPLDKPLKVFIYSFIPSLFLTIVSIVHVETRYLLAVYPFLYILLANFILVTLNFIRQKLSLR